ncbi:hypothetical protein, partial [Burkholderia gladioli]|uniref:hypothetical protein n=1 Tax=Burkholderia gladioli TaxID=28095 RepID=UPI0016405FF2
GGQAASRQPSSSTRGAAARSAWSAWSACVAAATAGGATCQRGIRPLVGPQLQNLVAHRARERLQLRLGQLFDPIEKMCHGP